MYGDVFQYDLPAPREIVEAMNERSSPLAALASCTRDVIVGELRRDLRFENLPHLAHLVDAILELPLSCLSAHEDVYWLTFHRSGFPIHLPGRNEIPRSLYDAFPIGNVQGLDEFLRYFGGMVHGHLDAAAGRFSYPSPPLIVSTNDPNYEWGKIGEWEGALHFYTSPSGNSIVIHRDGSPGKWDHEGGDWETLHEKHSIEEIIEHFENANQFTKLPYAFPELIDHFAEYLSWPQEDPRKRDSPFYY